VNTPSERELIPGRQRIRAALHGLLDLFGTLWFGGGVALLVLVLIGILTGQMRWEVGVPARVLCTAVLAAFIVGFGACTIAMGCAAFFELLAAVRGWVPKRPTHPTGNGGPEAT